LINEYNWDNISTRISQKTYNDVEAALNKTKQPNVEDFMALISPAAQPYLEQMAALSQKYTQQQFGKTIRFYLPLYLANSCVNHCVYCGFNQNNNIKRIILTDEQILREVHAIKSTGDFQHILLVTGENPRQVGVDYIENAIRLVKPYFSSISIEVQPLREMEYRRLITAGLNAVYCYQETYNKQNYGAYHPKGIKSDFDRRLDAFEQMGKAGVHKIGLGILIGLEDWRPDVTMIAYHLRYMQKVYWRTKYSISFPRIRPHAGEAFQPNVIMSDKELAQLIFAFRIFDHDIELALSTREDRLFRDNMATLGITTLSAGSKTDPGGYAVYQKELQQFSVNDNRTPNEIVQENKKHGYEVIWKDWDMSLQ
jgi:2-iminoacetate synthase